MKRLTFGMVLLVSVLLISACMPDLSGNIDESMEFSEEEAVENLPDENADDGFDFTDEEAQDIESEEGFDFTDEETQDIEDEDGFDFTEEEKENPSPEDEFPPSEGTEIPLETWSALPPAGKSTWSIVNEYGTIKCPYIPEIKMDRLPEELVTIEAWPPPRMELMSIEGIQEEGFLSFYRDLSKTGLAIYLSDPYTPPGAESPIYYEIIFENMDGGDVANSLRGYITGIITETVEGTTIQCDLFRSFYGNLVE